MNEPTPEIETDAQGWPVGSVRLMQRDRDGMPQLLGGAVSLCSAVQALYSLADSVALVWAEVLVGPRGGQFDWVELTGARIPWRQAVALHLVNCTRCRIFLEGKLVDSEAARSLLGMSSKRQLRRVGTGSQSSLQVIRREPETKAGAHTWGAFAYLAIESGGYADLTVINPWNGDSLRTYACKTGGTPDGDWIANPYTCLRNLIDAMEQAQFLGAAEQAPDSDGAS